MSNIEHKDVGVSSLKGTPSKKIYIKTSTEAVHNPEGVTQEYINNHVDGSKIVNGTIVNSKIANGAVSMNKLDNETQTLIQRGADSSWTPKGDFNIETTYDANDVVFDPETNSSYLSLRADNTGHPVDENDEEYEEGWWMKVLDGSYVNLLEEELQQLVDSISEGTQQQVEELNEALEALEAQADQSRQDIQDIVDGLAVVQTTGQSASDVMSQKAVTDEVTEPKNVDLSGETLEVGFFSGSGEWSTGTAAGRTIFLPVLPNEKYIMTAAASQNFYTILHSMFDTSQAQAQADIDYATGYSTRVQLAQGASVTLTIPSDGYFLAFRADVSGGNSFAPDLQKLIPIKEEIKDNFNRIGERRKIVLPNAITLGGWISNATFKWATRSTTYFSIIPVIGGKRMHWIYNGGSGYFHYAWLTDFDMIGQRNVTAGGTPSYVAGTSLVFQGIIDNNNIIVPATAKYLYIMHSYGGNANRLPTLYWIDQASDMEVNDVYSRVRGKYVSILGDSITSYFQMPTADAGDVYAYPQFPHFGVISWQQCWWGNLIERCGMNLLRNASWKGSTCCGNSQDASWKTGCSDARVALLTDGTTQPDIIIVAIGINDWIQDKTLGTFNPRALIPADGDLQVFVDAYIKMLAKLQAAYHHARIFCCTLMMSAHNTHDVDGKYPDLNDNGVSLYEFNQVIRQVADAMGVDILDISRCGLNFDNLSYYADYDLIHPNNYGMEKVADKAVAELLAKY